jgi:hypothetical protein
MRLMFGVRAAAKVSYRQESKVMSNTDRGSGGLKDNIHSPRGNRCTTSLAEKMRSLYKAARHVHEQGHASGLVAAAGPGIPRRAQIFSRTASQVDFHIGIEAPTAFASIPCDASAFLPPPRNSAEGGSSSPVMPKALCGAGMM